MTRAWMYLALISFGLNIAQHYAIGWWQAAYYDAVDSPGVEPVRVAQTDHEHRFMLIKEPRTGTVAIIMDDAPVAFFKGVCRPEIAL